MIRRTEGGSRRVGSLVSGLLLLAAVLPLAGQEVLVDDPDRDYAVAPGDVIGILVPRYTDYSGQFTIETDGTITVQLIEGLRVEGLTPPEIERLLTQRWSEYLLRPEGIRVRVLAKRMTVRVAGYVGKPGEMNVPRDASVQLVINEAGLMPGAVLSDIRLRRRSGEWIEEIPVDLIAYIEGRGELPPLQSGDELFVRKIETGGDTLTDTGGTELGAPAGRSGSQRGTATVLGAVGRPGEIPLRPDADLLNVLTAAAYLPEADLSKVTVLRGGEGEPEVYDLQAFLDRGAPVPPPIYPGDLVRVLPRTGNVLTVYVQGMVQRSGPVPVSASMTLQDVLTQAGGAMPDGDLHNVLIRRVVDGRPVELAVDLQAYIETGDVSLLQPLQNDDVIYVTRGRLPVDQPGASVEVRGTGVEKPGSYPLPLRRALVAVLGQAGRLPSANLSAVEIVHTDSEVPAEERMVVFDLAGYESGSGEPLPELRDGDIVNVGQRTAQVIGEVVRPGPVYCTPETNIVEALGLAGGVTPTADVRNIVIMRGETPLEVNLEALVEEPQTALPLVLHGDRILVREGVAEDRSVYVLGAVNSPGPVQITGRQATIVEAITRAGNITPLGDERRVWIIRPTSAAPEITPVDYGALIRGDTLGPPPVVRPGDLVRVDPLGESRSGVLLLGAFSQQGWIPYNGPGMTLLDCFAISHTPTDSALDRIRIIRGDGSGVMSLNIIDFTQRNKPWPEVYPGDVVAVDQRRQGTDILAEAFRIFGLVRFFQ